jgi:outer membrane protein TolC
MRLLSLLALIAASPAMAAERPDLPPLDRVMAALDGHPAVSAAQAEVEAAEAEADMLRAGPHEFLLSGDFIRRSVDREGKFDEYAATLSRAVRLPGKAGLDRAAGRAGIEAAENRMADARHEVALLLSTLWHDWLEAGALARADLDLLAAHDREVAALRRRLELRDAARIDLDRATAAGAAAAAQLAASRAMQAEARARLAAQFPELPLGAEPPLLADPALPAEGLQALRDLVISRSHEIGAAERDAERLAALAARARLDRLPDPSVGVRLFSERDGLERGAGVVASVPLGFGQRRAAAGQAGAQARAAGYSRDAVRREIAAEAEADKSNAETRYAAWQSAAEAASDVAVALARTEAGYRLGAIELADLLGARRQAGEARRTEIAARAQAARALLKIRIDAHVIWAPVEAHDH